MEKYKIVVSEPWDFESPSGNNTIIGKILKKVSSFSVVFLSESILKFNNCSGQLLILKTRYEKQLLTETNGYEGTVAGAILLTDDYEDKDEAYFEANSKYVFIGSLGVLT